MLRGLGGLHAQVPPEYLARENLSRGPAPSPPPCRAPVESRPGARVGSCDDARGCPTGPPPLPSRPHPPRGAVRSAARGCGKLHTCQGPGAARERAPTQGRMPAKAATSVSRGTGAGILGPQHLAPASRSVRRPHRPAAPALCVRPPRSRSTKRRRRGCSRGDGPLSDRRDHESRPIGMKQALVVGHRTPVPAPALPAADP